MSKDRSAHQYKNLHYESGERPAFLKRMMGQQQEEENDGRPAIPQRPEGDTYQDPSSDEEGDLAPQVVVLNANKHLTQEQVDATKRSSPSQLATQADPTPAPKDEATKPSKEPAVNYAGVGAPSTSKRKAPPASATTSKKPKKEGDKKSKSKKDKKGPLSFGDD